MINMYLVTTGYDMFVFETEETLFDFLNLATLPEYHVKEVEDTPLYRKMAIETAWQTKSMYL